MSASFRRGLLFALLLLLPMPVGAVELVAVGPKLLGYSIGMHFDEAVALHNFEQVYALAGGTGEPGNYVAKFRAKTEDKHQRNGFVQFLDNRIERILVYFPAEEMGMMEEALRETFGHPLEEFTEQVTSLGITVPGRFAHWQPMGIDLKLTYMAPLTSDLREERSGFVQLYSTTYSEYRATLLENQATTE